MRRATAKAQVLMVALLAVGCLTRPTRAIDLGRDEDKVEFDFRGYEQFAQVHDEVPDRSAYQGYTHVETRSVIETGSIGAGTPGSYPPPPSPPPPPPRPPSPPPSPPPPPPLDLRPFSLRLLGGSTAQEGWLQVSDTGSSGWGNLCVRDFTEAEATVACRQLGLGVLGLPRTTGFAPPAPGTPTLVNVLSCRGNEESLEDCTRTAWGEQACQGAGGNIAGVVCIADMSNAPVRVVGGPDSTSGIVQLDTGAGWASICAYDMWNKRAAKVACRSLGFQWGLPRVGAQASGWEAPAAGTPIVLGGVACIGNETSVVQCSSRGWGVHPGCVDQSRVAGVVCYDTAPPPPAPGELPALAVRLVPALGAEPSPAGTPRGILQVKPLDGSSDWSPVCGTYWTEAQATVACRQLGFPAGGTAVRASQPAAGGPPATALGRLTCATGTEPTLDECTSDAAAGGDSTSIASPYACPTVAAVSCRASAPIQLRLASTSAAEGLITGRLEASLDSGSTWASVCASGFDASDSAVACRQLGYGTVGAVHGNTTDVAAYPALTDADGSFLGIITRPRCGGGEPDMGWCAVHWEPQRQLLPCLAAATVVCNMTRDSGVAAGI